MQLEIAMMWRFGIYVCRTFVPKSIWGSYSNAR
jgi:hypothetical protein